MVAIMSETMAMDGNVGFMHVKKASRYEVYIGIIHVRASRICMSFWLWMSFLFGVMFSASRKRGKV